MDKKFLEFWGNLLLASAKGQQQLEEMAPWLKGAGLDSDGLGSLFQKSYGLDTAADGSKTWEQARQQFQTSFKEWMALLDMVPRKELTAVEKKNQELRQELTDQQVTIEQLQRLLNEKDIPSSKAMLDFTRLMQTQSAQFQDLMASVGAFFETGTGSDSS